MGSPGWNLADHQRYGGEPSGGAWAARTPAASCASSTRSAVPSSAPGGVGLLEVRAAQLGTDDWVRTTDLARLDADGFLWIVGRADQTILRGGYKVQPEVVRAALERDPRVREAAVVGISDVRLGAVPVAAVERRPGRDIDEASLLARASSHLAPYELPVAVSVVDELPRTTSGKVDLAAIRALFDRVVATARGS